MTRITQPRATGTEGKNHESHELNECDRSLRRMIANGRDFGTKSLNKS
jgi:hypothetical protein